MLAGSVYKQLADVYRSSNAALDQARERASVAEVERAISDALNSLAGLAQLLGLGDVRDIGQSQLARHLGWLRRYYRDGEHGKYASDVMDIRERDLPAVAHFVEQWERSLVDPQLLQAIETAWADRNFLAVVRDAFVHLEDRIRQFGDVSATEGMTADRLVGLLFGPTGDALSRLPPDGLLGPVTAGEQQGLLHLFKGAFLFVRNPTAHRRIDYSPAEAEAIVDLVDLCLRVISSGR
jgi:hypothetical protein